MNHDFRLKIQRADVIDVTGKIMTMVFPIFYFLTSLLESKGFRACFIKKMYDIQLKRITIIFHACDKIKSSTT